MHPDRLSDIRQFTPTASTNVNGRRTRCTAGPTDSQQRTAGMPPSRAQHVANDLGHRDPATASRLPPHRRHRSRTLPPTPPIKDLATDATDQGLAIDATDDGRCTPATCPIFADLPGPHRPTSTAGRCGAQPALPAATLDASGEQRGPTQPGTARHERPWPPGPAYGRAYARSGPVRLRQIAPNRRRGSPRRASPVQAQAAPPTPDGGPAPRRGSGGRARAPRRCPGCG
jgi:hypothetical protein